MWTDNDQGVYILSELLYWNLHRQMVTMVLISCCNVQTILHTKHTYLHLLNLNYNLSLFIWLQEVTKQSSYSVRDLWSGKGLKKCQSNARLFLFCDECLVNNLDQNIFSLLFLLIVCGQWQLLMIGVMLQSGFCRSEGDLSFSWNTDRMRNSSRKDMLSVTLLYYEHPAVQSVNLSLEKEPIQVAQWIVQ